MLAGIVLNLKEQTFRCSTLKKKILAKFPELKPCGSPPPFLFFFLSFSFLTCLFCGEAYIFVSAGDTSIETKINKSAEKLTPTVHSGAWKTRF